MHRYEVEDWVCNTFPAWVYSYIYRLIYRIFDRCETRYYNLKNGIYNLWRWFPIVWRDRDWDWAYTASIMEWKFRKLADCMENGHHLHGKRDARRVRVACEILRRLQNDTEVYYNGNAKDGNRHMREDQAYLGRLLGKYLTHWWD